MDPNIIESTLIQKAIIWAIVVQRLRHKMVSLMGNELI